MRDLSYKCVRNVAVLFAFAGAALGQVTLTVPAPGAFTSGTNITLAGTGYPAGTVVAASVSITITPSAGNGSPVSFAPSAVTGSAPSHGLIFKIPPALIANQPYNATISMTGQTTGNVSFSSSNSPTIVINPVATVANVSPGAGQTGTAVNVTLTGNFSHWAQNTSVITAGAGITVSNMVVNAVTQQATATFTIDPAAVVGPRTVTVTTGGEVAALPVGFVVVNAPGLSFSNISPNTGAQGTNFDVTVTGVNTHFLQGTTTANFGDGITVNSVNVMSLTTTVVHVTVSPLARTGGRAVTVVTGGEFAMASNGFMVTSSGASISTVSPNTAPQGTNATVQITGVGTHFVNSATTVSFGGGINVGNITWNNPTSLTVNISVGPGVAPGAYTVSASTNGEVAALNSAFTVTASTPFLSGVTPTTGAQGTTLDVNVTGTFTNFTLGSLSANFGPNIMVNSATPIDATHAKLNITIPFVTAVGGRTVTLTSNGTDFFFTFSVTSSAATVTSVSPGSGLQQSSVALQVTGANTHWVQGTTVASLGDVFVTVNRVVVNSPTSAEVDITIGAQASLSTHPISMTTGGEVATLSNAFTVLPFTPSLTLMPSSGMIGTSLTVNFNGNFTHFSNQTLANIDGEGINMQNFTVTGPSTATAKFVIDPNAPSSPAFVCVPGNRTVTLTTGNEIVTAPFCVTSTPAVLTSITPFHSPEPNVNLNVTITGQFTHFTNGGANPTMVGFGPNIVVNTTNAISATQVNVNISIAANAALGYRQAFVNTGAEQLSIGFLIDSPSSASLVSVAPPSAQQGQTVNGVLITGNLTNFNANTIAILGAGVTVSNLNVLNPTSATATVAVSPTTPVGGRTVSMISGAETVSGPLFGVTPGVASITLQTNNDGQPINQVHQGDIVVLRINGSATHFLQGETTVDMGPGITLSAMVVTSPTQIVVQAAVAFNAPIGFHQVTATTDGEVAPANSTALNVLVANAVSFNITPTSSQQGTHLTVQMNGIATTWVNGVTTVSFGNNNGLTVNSVTVINPTQANIDLTVKGTTFVGPYSMTVTTDHGGGNIEQLSAPNIFGVSTGAAIIINTSPNSGAQGATLNFAITGQNTTWTNGVTSAYFTTGGCIGSPNPGVNVANVMVTDLTHSMLSVAISPTAQTGLQTLCMATLGELVSFQNAFTLVPGTPTLNGVTPVSAQQGTNVTGLAILGQFTHWVQGTTTATFGQGITLQSLTITDSTHALANISIDPLAYTGSRNVVLNTNGEIVQGTAFFSIVPGPAILHSIAPTTGNQGTHVLMQVTGQNTHWAQGLSQITITGAGFDITVNGFQVTSSTTAIMDMNISPTANLGVRTVFVSTGGENVALNNAFIVTGGIPSISSITPSSYQQGSNNVNVMITGIFTHWDNTTTAFFGPNITVNSVTRNSDTNITAIITVPNGAPLGLQPVTIQTGPQSLMSSVNITSNAPPTPYISYLYPGVALVGQTLSVNISGQFTHWLPGTTNITFGAGIVVNTFQVTGLNTATANISIDPAATVGTRTVTMTTGAEVENSSFYVTVGTPAITLLSPGSIIQGQTHDVDVVGQYTTFSSTPGVTVFNFGQGITVNSVQFFGPTAARVNVSASITANLGGRSVTATTGTQVAFNSGFAASFSVSPSQATITMVSPNTDIQGHSPVVHVTGFLTNWDNTTVFSMGGIGITNKVIDDNLNADLTLSIPPLATPGFYNITAVTGGEVATLANAFVVQPGTPILVSATGASVQQGMNFSVGILGQFTAFDNTTVVNFGTGVNVTGINVTSANSITVTGNADPTAFVGGRNVVVTTGPQVLALPGAFQVTPGTAAITLLTPNAGNQGQTLNVVVTGTNTHFAQGVTVGNFGAGISVNTLTVNTPTSATANITIAANAISALNSVNLTTLGESASIASAFTITASTPILNFINPTSLGQGNTTTITINGSFTHFTNGNTTADFGPGTSPGVVNATDSQNATVSVTVLPTAIVGTRTPRMITSLGGGQQEIAIKANAFTITAGNATISNVAPNSGQQNQNSLSVVVTGTGTHFDGTTTLSFNDGNISVTQITNVTPTSFTATVNIGPNAAVGPRTVTVTTGGEIAQLLNGFNVTVGTPVISQVNPQSAQQNAQGFQFNINSLFTHFTNASNVSFADPNIVVTNVVANSVTSLTVTINVAPAATVGSRTITVTTGAEVVSTTVNTNFQITAGTPTLSSVMPNTGAQGSSQLVTVNGLFTHFTAGSVIAFSGSGLNLGSVNFVSAQVLTIQVTVTPGAAATARQVSVTTGAEVVALNSAFTVLPGAPTITDISPNVGTPNSTVTVQITGQFTNFVSGSTTASFGQGISVNGGPLGMPGNIVVSSATTATAMLTIDSSAMLATRDVTITDPTDPPLTVLMGFTIQANAGQIPTVTTISPANGFTGAPINTAVKIQFSQPMDKASITTANAFLTDSLVSSCWATSGIPATVVTDASGRITTITPMTNLAVGRVYYVQLNSAALPGGAQMIKDNGDVNTLGHTCYSFTSGFTTDSTGPTFIDSSIPAGSTTVPTNVINISLGFDKPINPLTQPAGISIMQGANSVPGVWGYTTDFLQAIFTPSAALTPSSPYTITYTAALQGQSGNPLTNPGTLSFMTAAGPDNTSPTYTSWTPPQGSAGTPTTGTSPTVRFVFNRPVNPLTVTPAGFYVYDIEFGNVVSVGSTVTYTPDHKTFTLNLPGPLQPGTNYHWTLTGVRDWIGNQFSGAVNFTTGTGPDSIAPTVTSVSPSSGTTCVGSSPCAAVNSKIEVKFSEWMDPTSLQTNSISLNPSVAGTYSFSTNSTCTTPSSSSNCDFTVLTFTPSAPLATNTTYQISVGNLTDLSGNSLVPFGPSSFKTAASSTPDMVSGTISTTPTSGAVNVPVNQNVVANFNKAVNPLSIDHTSFRVFDNGHGTDVPGNIVVSADQKTVTFTPTSQYRASAQICAYIGYYESLYDLAGNIFNYNAQCFTTGNTPDVTAPTVSASPANNATGVGPNQPITLMFSKSMNSGTLTNNAAIYQGSTLYTNSYSLSGDGTGLSFSTGNLPFSTQFTIVLNTGAQDLSGNSIASQFTSTFTTAPQPLVARPSVSSVRPANAATGVPVNSVITFFTTAPMNSATVSSAMTVSQNGVVVTGTTSVLGNGQTVVFTPTGGNFQAGVRVEAWFSSAALDTGGNQLFDYYTQFTTAPDLSAVPLVEVSNSPCRNCGGLSADGLLEIQFSKPLSPATVTSSNFFIQDNSSNPVAGTILPLANNGKLLRFQPTSNWNPNKNNFTVHLTTGLQDTNNLAFAGDTYIIAVNSTTDATVPSVTGFAPTNGSTGIGTNAVITVTFSKNVDALSINSASVQLNGGAIPAIYSLNSNYLTITPQAPLPPSSAVTVTLNGITDAEGHGLTGAPVSFSFNTAAAPDFAGPVLVSSNPTPSQTNVPVNSVFTLTFNKPLDGRTVNTANVYVIDQSLGSISLNALVTLNGAGTQITVSPGPMSVNHSLYLHFGALMDLNGNLGPAANIFFTTALTGPVGGPQVISMLPLQGEGGIPENFKPTIQFDRPVSALSLGGITLTNGGSVAFTPALSAGNTVLQLSPNAILTPGNYVLTITGVTDAGGNTMAGSVVRNFTVVSKFDLNVPVILSYTPPNSQTNVGTNPVMRFTFNKPINAILTNGFHIYNYSLGAYLNNVTLTWAADLQSVQLIAPGPLDPQSHYQFYCGTVYDLAGNLAGCPAPTFFTGSGTDNVAPTVSSVTPPTGSTVARNPQISVEFSEAIDPTIISNSSLTLTPSIPGATVTLTGTSTLNYVLPANTTLSSSTGYTITVPAGGVKDLSGNPLAAQFTSAFTTSTSTDTTNGTISLTNPAPGATGVPVTTVIEATFSKPYNPLSISPDSMVVFPTANSNLRVAGTITLSAANKLTFTPAVALPANTAISVYTGYYATIQDLAGNNFSSLTLNAFQTAVVVDNTPPSVVSVTPTNGSTNVGPVGNVTITFNRSLDPNTITSNNFALFQGSNNLNANVSYSSDRRSVTLSITFPYSTTITVNVSTGVKDYAGNNMAAPFTSSFTTVAQSLTATPSIILTRPANGASSVPLNSVITMFTSAPMSAGTVPGAVFVSQNGTLMNGTVTLSPDNRAITFTPQAPGFQGNALIEVFVTSAATDTSGNPLTYYSFSFHTQPDYSTAPPVILSYSFSNQAGGAPTNQVFEALFSRPLNPATVNLGTTFTVMQNNVAVPGTLTLTNNNTIIRFKPTSQYANNNWVMFTLTNGIQDASADAFAGATPEFFPNGGTETATPPTVTDIDPVNNAGGVGINAPIRITFSKIIDTLSFNPSTVTLTSGAAIPYSVSFSTPTSLYTVATITPQAPFPASATIALNLLAGLADRAGNSIVPVSYSFGTAAAANFTGPSVTSTTLNNNSNQNIALNSSFMVVFNEPLDPASVNSNTVYIYDQTVGMFAPVNLTLSANGMTITVTPNPNLTASHSMYLHIDGNITDLSGNTFPNAFNQFFTTSAAIDNTPPSVLLISPANNTTAQVPTNAPIDILFSEAVSGTSLGQITISGGGNVPYSAAFENSLIGGNVIVRLTPVNLLQANTTYTVTLQGVTDIAGNVMPTQAYTFTTGVNFSEQGPSTVVNTINLQAGSTVPLPLNTTITGAAYQPTITVTFDVPIDPTTLTTMLFLYDSSNTQQPYTFTQSADMKTIVVHSSSPLVHSANYRFFIYYQIRSLSQASGNFQESFPFTVAP